ncbi:MAG: hypothetical protein IJK64_09785 [Clostridia bacterium]|nr:hypothetical protein [Clostridia bacterium]
MQIIIDQTTPLRPFHHHWKFCVGSAHAAYALRHDYAKQLAQVHRELGIERVRFHGIFGDELHTLVRATQVLPFPFGRGYGEQSFRQCANVYDNILEAGMTPFAELSFVPKRLAKLPFARGMFYYRPVVSLPRSTAQWQDYIARFVRFLIDRYGREEVARWYFEVWNEPDLPVVFFDGRQKDYFRLYQATAQAIKGVDGGIRVGGPATSGSKWIAEFLAFCRQNGAPVDFISTHQYAGDPIGGIEQKAQGAALNIDPLAALRHRATLDHGNILDLFRAFMGVENAPQTLRADALQESAKNVKALAGDLPVFYTEWNMCASFSAPCNDTAMQACYQLHAILNTQESVDGSSIWCFSDLFEEFHQFPEEFHGGFGLLTQSGVKKPAYHALRFLHEAGDECYDLPTTGDADLVVFKNGNALHVIASLLDFEESGRTEQIGLKIQTHAPSDVTLHRIGADSANPLACWEAMGRPQTPTPAQLDALKAAATPREEAAEFTYADGWLHLDFSVKSNEIKRFVVSIEE